MSAHDLPAPFPYAGDSHALEAFVRILATQASVGIFLADAQGQTIYLNERLRRMAGLSGAPAAKECWLDALIPEDHDLIVTEWASAIAQDRSFSREFRFQRPDGTVRWVMAEAFPVRIDDAPAHGYAGMVRDITPRQLALDALHACEERYRMLASASPQPVLVFADETLLFMNEAGIRLFGLPAAPPLEGHAWSEWFAKEFLQDLPLSTPATPVERHYACPDGSGIDVELLASAVMFDGHPAVQVLATDRTEQKQLVAQLRRSHKMAAVATLAGGMAHEFNNCLTAIMGFSDLALPLLAPDSRVHGHVQQVLLASRRARDLVTQMLTFGRQAEGAKQPVSLDILLKETLRMMKGRLPKTISLREWIPGATHPIVADPTQLHQLCVRLLTHTERALRATGGVLEVRLDNVDLSRALDRQELPLRPGPYVRLTVSDMGHETGVADQSHKREPLFAHLPAGAPVDVELAAAQQMVSEQGGTLRATSSVGQGSTIEVYLPACIPPGTVVTPEPERNTPSHLTEQRESLAERDKQR
ncbi:MAG: PAS domain S-box protein [Nitrospira sp.]|nr:PAS domain S-box protein [Nitrospira sp.]